MVSTGGLSAVSAGGGDDVGCGSSCDDVTSAFPAASAASAAAVAVTAATRNSASIGNITSNRVGENGTVPQNDALY